MRPEDHHRARQQAGDGTLPWRLDWPTYTYLPRGVLGGWLMRQCGWTQSRDVSDLMMPVAQLGASLIGFDASPIVARFDSDVAEAVMATPISGDLPIELLHRLPAWTIAVPMPWTSRGLVAFVTVDTGITTFDGVTLDDGGLDQLLITYVTDTDVVPCPMELGAGSIAEQLARNVIVGNPGARPTRLHPASLEETRCRLGIEVSVSRLLEQTMALILYLCSEAPDVTTIRAPLTVAEAARHRPRATAPAVEVLDVGYRIGVALRTAARDARRAPDGGEAGARRRPVPHLRRAHFHLYWYGPRNEPAARVPKIRWVAPIPVNVGAGGVVLTVRDVDDRKSERSG